MSGDGAEGRTAHLTRERDEAIKGIPSYLRHAIYLPTEQIPLDEQIAGLKAVRELYAGPMDEIHRPALRQLKAARTRKRCFVIGNGPSLLQTDLTKLKDEVTFVMNGFFLKMPELDWTPTFYVCEDHLVAEDRAKEINALKGPTKLFPASLRYVIEPDEYTVYYDHRPRKSYPHGFDFSFDADVNTFTGGTVTFSCLQLAAYMGFEEIYLIGVDASYAIPADATLGGGGRIKELDMKSDDPNHFHPDYFGKGKRWHEPNVDTMILAYEEARRACDARGVAIYNAGIGGKLEVFPRVKYDDLFPPPPASLPRVLLFDLTRMGDGTATGELKASLFRDWPRERILQVYSAGKSNVGTLINGATGRADLDEQGACEKLRAQVLAFAPDLIIYRPVPNSVHLHEFAMDVIAETDAPLVSWIMDDWPASLETRDRRQFAKLEPDLRSLLRQSAGALSIGEAMSKAFEPRYGLPFQPFANGIERSDWNWSAKREAGKGVLLRYSGSLAEDMGLEAIVGVARAVEQLAADGLDISLEVKTRSFWAAKAGGRFKDLTHTTLLTDEMSPADYREWLSGADIVLICYNFDEASKAYVRYSIANKLPECLASGAALLAVGPEDLAMMGILRELECSVNIQTLDPATLAEGVGRLANSQELREELAARARKFALDRFDLRVIRQKFVAWILQAVEIGRTDKVVRAMRGAESRLRAATRGAGERQPALVDAGASAPIARRPVQPAVAPKAPVGGLTEIGDRLGVVASSIGARFAKAKSGR